MPLERLKAALGTNWHLLITFSSFLQPVLMLLNWIYQGVKAPVGIYNSCAHWDLIQIGKWIETYSTPSSGPLKSEHIQAGHRLPSQSNSGDGHPGPSSVGSLPAAILMGRK